MLSSAEKSKIARDTVLGVPAAGEESEEARDFRAGMQKDVDHARENGYQLDPPWDWEENDPEAKPVAKSEESE